MSHQTRRGPPVECPLASLGRNTTALDTQQQYHHPLSSSPLNLQVYQMSRKSPDLSIDTDDIIYTSTTVSQQIGGENHSHCGNNLPEMFHLSRSSSSSMDQAYDMRRNPQVNQSSRHRPVPPRNYTPIESLLQFRETRTPSAYILPANDTNDGSHEVPKGNSGNGNGVNVNGRRSVPPNSSSISNGQYFLEKKMDQLYIQGAIRGLPLGSEANHFQNERYFLEDDLRNLCEFNGSDRLHESHILHRPSSPSETSGSDRYLLDRTQGSPAAYTNVNQQRDSSFSNHSSNVGLEKRFHPSKVKSLSEGLSNLGRFSPSLDQGYATLVSPSPTGHPIPGPGPWSKKGPCRSGPGFDRLPDEAVLKILSWLDSCELCNVARVCRRFENLAWRPILWKIITLKGEHIGGDKALKMIFRQLCGQTRNGSCPDVERVMLSDGCRISDKGLLLLTRRCPELTHLQLQTCVSVTNQALCDVLTKCTNLQHLDITGCTQIINVSINPGLEPPRRLLLQYLDLTDCTAVDDVGLKVVVKNCPQLVFLYLRRCIQITDAGLKFVPSFCNALKELSVSDCLNITDFGLYELAKLGAALRYLSVAKCDRVSDAGLKVIARRCYKLRYLNARGCEAVSDDSITVLARSCPRLRALDIGKCDVSDAGLRALAESCPNLKKLSLRNCDMITDRGVQCIAYYCRGLQQLNIQDCQISIEGYRAVKKYCKRCIIEHTNPGFC